MRIKAVFVAATVLALQAPLAHAQVADTSRSREALRVFLDCQNVYCDFDFLRTEIGFVEWVRDQRVAQIHLLITSQQTGSGGKEYSLSFAGREQFLGSDQLLRHVSLPTESSDDIRRGLAHTIMLGLARYAAATPLAPRLKLSYDAPAGADTARRATRDPWNYWVYKVNTNVNLDGESRAFSRNYRASLSAERITAQWKMELNGIGRYSEQQYIVSYDTTSDFIDDAADTTRVYSHNYNTSALMVKSMGDHWSSGAEFWASSSTYGNQKLTLQAGPALEYSLFPYKESTRRQLTLRYSVRANQFLYNEETIYFVDKERRWDHTLEGELETNQEWGQAEIEVRARQYFFDPSKRSLSMYGNAEYRVFKGFSVDFFGGYELVHDQLALERGGASANEVYLRLREQQTDYRFYMGFGISYTFGSIYNSVVNPRFP